MLGSSVIGDCASNRSLAAKLPYGPSRLFTESWRWLWLLWRALLDYSEWPEQVYRRRAFHRNCFAFIRWNSSNVSALI